jgi:hypothetical protein
MAQLIGRHEVWLVESLTRPHKPHVVIKLGTGWACGCDSVKQCRHINEAIGSRRALLAEQRESKVKASRSKGGSKKSEKISASPSNRRGK